MPEIDPESGLSIPDALASLRKQIREAVATAEGKDLVFDVQSIQVELQLTVTTALKGEAKVALWNVVSLGGGAERASAATHRVTLTLEPQFVENSANHEDSQGPAPRRRVRVADRG
ncbi:trypco2 family protein [Streptomyces sp. NPDC048577]|uniref:trypco2 family protein n=1 Tax=Streptomyces sp. NPDC048577 TaxID=3157209 RepID=UPI003438D9EE